MSFYPIEITEDSYKSFSLSQGPDDHTEIVSVTRVNFFQGRSLTVIHPSDTERNCTFATSNVVSSQVLTPQKHYQISPPPSPTKPIRSPQILSPNMKPVKGKPALIDYLPQNLALLNDNFNLRTVIETKFMRTLNTALLMIIAAHKTEGIPQKETTRLQFGCGYGGFEGLHSSLIPEPSLIFESEKFKKYVRDFTSNWIQDMESALVNLSQAATSKDSCKALEELLFGPDLQLLLVFFNQEKDRDLIKHIQDYAKNIQEPQAKLIKFFQGCHNEDIKEYFSEKDISYMTDQVKLIKDALNKALENNIIELKGNVLCDTHFHYSCNAIDILPDSFNQFDTLIENKMREQLVIAISESSHDQTNSINTICTNFINALTECLKKSSERVNADLATLKDLADYQECLEKMEKQLQKLLEMTVKQLKEEEKDASLDYNKRLGNLRNNKALIDLYFDYIHLLHTISDTVSDINPKQTHAQISQTKNFFEGSTKDTKDILVGFYVALFEENIWYQLKSSGKSPIAFLRSKFNFLTEDISLNLPEAKNKMRLLTEHFRRLSDALKIKFNAADPLRILKKTTNQRTFFSQGLNSNEKSFETLLESSFLLLRQKSCPKNLVEQIHTLCQKLVDQALEQDCGLLTKFIRTPYLRYIGYKPEKPQLSCSEIAISPSYLNSIIDSKSPVDVYLNTLNQYIAKTKEPLKSKPTLDTRLAFANDMVAFLNTCSLDSIDAYPDFLNSQIVNSLFTENEKEELKERIELAQDMATFSSTLPPNKKPLSIDDYSIQLNSYIRATYTAAKLKERFDFAMLIVNFMTQMASDENVLPRVQAESVRIIKSFNLDTIASGKFFSDFNRLVNLPKDFPGTEGLRIQSTGLFLQFALSDTNNLTYLGIPHIKDHISKINTDIEKFLQPKEEKKFSISESRLKLEFLCTFGLPAYSQILKDYTDRYLMDLTVAEISVAKQDAEISKLSMHVLKQRPLGRLAPWLLASIMENKHTLFKSKMRQVRVADRMFTGIQDRFTCDIIYDPARNIYVINLPNSFSLLNKLHPEQIAYKIYEIIKDSPLSENKENKKEEKKIAFNVEVYIDYFTK